MRRIILALVLLCVASPVSATTYYVRTDGANTNAGTSNTAGGAFQTIAKGCQTAVAGDTVRVQPGTYLETASGCTSGTSGNTVTLIADGSVTTCAISFTGKSYIRVIGFTMSPTTSGCSGSGTVVTLSGTNTGLEFWNNTVGGTQSDGFGMATTTALCNACIYFGNTVHNIGNTGNSIGLKFYGNDVFAAYNHFSTIDYLGISQDGNRIRQVNNNFDGFLGTNGFHPDFFYIGNASLALGYATSLIESSFGIGTNEINQKYYHSQNQSPTAWTNDVWRLNVAYGNGDAAAFSIFTSTAPETGQWFYNETKTYGDRAHAGDPAFTNCGDVQNQGGGTITYFVYNSIFYQCWADGVNTSIAPWSTQSPTGADYNLGFTPLASPTWAASWTSQAHEITNLDPKLVDPTTSTYNFTLGASSPATGAGGPITTATSCSGNVLNVATGTGGAFIADNSANLPAYSGAFVPGDFLTIDSTTHQVASISGDAITLADAAPACANGDSVFFGTSSTVDIGAYPYKATGYGLSATYTVGTPYTITPNDNSLVRFVVCYDSNVPYAVVNSSPYTCPAPVGTFSAMVYPKFASQIQGVSAINSAALIRLKPRLRLRIIRGDLALTLAIGPVWWRLKRSRWVDPR